MGLPGHTGQGSAAALSQTVNTKCINGAPGRANSPQSLLLNPSVGSWFFSSSSKAKGFYDAGRLASGAEGIEFSPAETFEDSLSHDAPRRIAGAEK